MRRHLGHAQPAYIQTGRAAANAAANAAAAAAAAARHATARSNRQLRHPLEIECQIERSRELGRRVGRLASPRRRFAYMRLAAQIGECAQGYRPHLMKGAIRDALSRNQSQSVAISEPPHRPRLDGNQS